MPQLKRLVGFWLFLSFAALYAQTNDKSAIPADEVIIKMDPYVISGERVLPPPESWRYVLVPALELTRGKRVILAPGYQVLSNLSEKNTRIFVEELQYFQFASTYLWPMIAQSLPREPLVVVLDQTRQAMTTPEYAKSLLWDGDPINYSADSSFSGHYDSQAFTSGVQIYESGAENRSIPEFFATEPEIESSANLSNRITLDGQNKVREPTPFKRRWNRPLPDGFTYLSAKNGFITAQISANGPLANSNNPVEEKLAADLSRRMAEYVLFHFTTPPPQWFRAGLGWLIATTQISPTRITFADTGGMLDDTGSMASLRELLNTTGTLSYEQEVLAAAFTHWGMYGENRKHAQKFMSLVEKQSVGPITPEEFESIMGLSYKKAELSLSSHSRTIADYTSFETKGEIPPMPVFTVVEASQAEVARLKGSVFLSQGKDELALNEMRIAYWRGEREPAMLAMLADLEEAKGSVERARKIVQGLVSLKTPPNLAYFVEARVRLRDFTSGKPTDYRLTAKETGKVMASLGRILQAGTPSEPICEFLASVVLRSNGKPHESVAAFLEKAAKRFPKNSTIVKSLHFAQTNAPASTALPTNITH